MLVASNHSSACSTLVLTKQSTVISNSSHQGHQRCIYQTPLLHSGEMGSTKKLASFHWLALDVLVDKWPRHTSLV